MTRFSKRKNVELGSVVAKLGVGAEGRMERAKNRSLERRDVRPGKVDNKKGGWNVM